MTNLLVLVGYGGSVRALDGVAEVASQHLDVPVTTATLETWPSVGESIQTGIADHAPRRIVVQPLFAGASTAKLHNLSMIVDAANERGFDAVSHLASPLDMHSGVVSAYRDLLKTTLSDVDLATTALLIVSRNARDLESRAGAAWLGVKLTLDNVYRAVEVAFIGPAGPDIAAGLQRCVDAGARRVVVVPYLLYDEALDEMIAARVQSARLQYPRLGIRMVTAGEPHTGLLLAIEQRYHEALAAMMASLTGDGVYIPRPHSHGPDGMHTHGTATSNGALDLLPPRYQGDVTVSAAPMGAADLKYDTDGRVAWDSIWGDFCDLALAGGPPHRGTLLEPVTPDAVRADAERYAAVVAEIERGIRMITGLPTVTSAAPGWVGMACDDEDMALWLLRAIVVENVSVRREGAVLFFPAGPDFWLDGEIKNVITVVAKTHHYWTEHRTELG
jgi:sirohydrochlorin cobaltochelatase